MIQFNGPNYSNLPNKVYFIHTVDYYNVLENYFWANQTAREIIKKFAHLYELVLGDQIRDVNQFIGVLKDRRYLNRWMVIELYDRTKFQIRLDGVRNVFNNLEDLMSHLEIYYHKTPFS